MEWNVLVIKLLGITNRQLSNGSMHYTTKQLAEFRPLSAEILLFDVLVLLVC